MFKNLYKYRYLLVEIVKKNIKLQYRNSVLGVFWTFLQPLLTTLVLVLVFSNIFGRDNKAVLNYPVYLLCGLEDISDSRLDSYDKRNTVAVNEQCIAVCQKYGVRLMAMFILGLDWRGRDFRQLYRYIVKHDLKHVAVSIYTPEIGISDAAYITDDLTHFDYLHLVAKPVHLSVRQWYFHYYVLLIRLFLKAQRDGVYDFLDYGSYIRSFLRTILHRSEEDA